MGRRALPKYDRTLDISQHHYFLKDIPKPFVVEAIFPGAGELEIEIGSGKGLFILNESGRNPQRNYLGIEAARKYARFAAFRCARAQRDNARMISGDAIQFFNEYLPDPIAAAVHIYFPDPWWKAKHRRRRIIQESVIKDIERVLLPGGRLHFWTDVQEYFESAVQMIPHWASLQGPHEVSESPAEDDMDYRTHFERRMRLNDHPVFRSLFVKSE